MSFSNKIFNELSLGSGRLFLFTLSALCFGVFLLHAWVWEDAFITFRVVDNFVHGYGLRWNIDERVQVYSHPLWLLSLIPFYAIFGHIYWVTIAVSAVYGIAILILMANLLPASCWRKALLGILPLLLSKTFNDFVICGLENPMVMVFLAWFMLELLRTPAAFCYERLCLAAALCLTTRMDSIFILLPGLLWGTWICRKQWRLWKTLLAFGPFLGWCMFSIVYYGFFLPNTKYAKTGSGISLSLYIEQGSKYLIDCVTYDKVGALLIMTAFISAAYGAFKMKTLPRHLEDKYPQMMVLCCGIALNIIYILLIGGDYIIGRFCSNIVLAAVAVNFAFLYRRTQLLALMATALSLVFILQAHAVLPRYNPFYHRGNFYPYHLSDYRRNYYKRNALFSLNSRLSKREPKPQAYEPDDDSILKVTIDGRAGGGYNAGPHRIIIDSYGLCDALLARLPTAVKYPGYAGHLIRNVPKGYPYARRTGNVSRMNPALAEYYQKLRLVTSGDLFSTERLEAIIGFQLGWYDDWRDAFLEQGKARLRISKRIWPIN